MSCCNGLRVMMITTMTGRDVPMETQAQPYVGDLLNEQEDVYREAVRKAIVELLSGKTEVEIISISGNLIEYLRDQVLSALAAIRRSAAIQARGSMSPDEIVQATGLSKPTVSRLITEYRNY